MNPQAEDAVCLANYCDIMRCDVLGPSELESSLVDDPTGALNTDIQVWRENTESRTTIVPCECRDLGRVYGKVSDKSEVMPASSSYHQKHCRREESGPTASSAASKPSDYHRNIVAGPDNKSSACENNEDEDDDPSNLVEAALPPHVNRKEKRRQSEIRKLKSNCRPEELAKLKVQCEVSKFLIRILLPSEGSFQISREHH